MDDLSIDDNSLYVFKKTNTICLLYKMLSKENITDRNITLELIRQWEKDGEIELPSYDTLLERYDMLRLSYINLAQITLDYAIVDKSIKLIEYFTDGEITKADVYLETIKCNKIVCDSGKARYVLFQTSDNWFILTKVTTYPYSSPKYSLKEFKCQQSAEEYFKRTQESINYIYT